MPITLNPLNAAQKGSTGSLVTDPTPPMRNNAITSPAASHASKKSAKIQKLVISPTKRKKRSNGDNGNGKRCNPLKKIDLAEACKMRFTERKTLAEIGKYFDISLQAVDQSLRRFTRMFGDPAIIKIFRDNEPTVWDNLYKIGVNAIIENKDSLTPSEAIKLVKESFLAKRLINDQSTSNVHLLHSTPEGRAAMDRGAEAYISGAIEAAKNIELELIRDKENEE